MMKNSANTNYFPRPSKGEKWPVEFIYSTMFKCTALQDLDIPVQRDKSPYSYISSVHCRRDCLYSVWQGVQEKKLRI